MSDGMNKVLLLGRLGADPILRSTQSGRSVLNIRMATDESYLDKDKVRRTMTEWHNVVVWGNRATGLAKALTKGSQILVEGSLRTSSYEKDGVKRYQTEIHMKEMCFTGSGKNNGGGKNDGETVTHVDEPPPGFGDGEEIPY